MSDTQDELVEGLVALAREAAVTIEPQMAAKLVGHLRWVLHTNETLNLTALTDPDEALRLHILDSICAKPEVFDAPEGVLVDLGTGGGFPGLPLALVCGRRAILLDSVKKKANALELFLRELDIDAHAVGVRAEEYALAHRREAAVVVARAVAPTAALIELAAPLLATGGRLVALKGRLEPEEVVAAARTADRCGMTLKSTRDYTLPGGLEGRCVVVFECTGEPHVNLPRRIGMAQKRPVS